MATAIQHQTEFIIPLPRFVLHQKLQVVGFFSFLFSILCVSAQSNTSPLIPQNRHLPKDIRTQSIYDKDGKKIVSKYQYYYDHWSEQSIKHGLQTKWDKNGTIRQEREYKEGQLIHQISRNSEGDVLKEQNWQNGLKHGAQRTFFSHNRLKHEIHYKEGRKEGLEKGFYLSGEIKWVRIYHHGKRQGKPSDIPRMAISKEAPLL